MVRGETKRTTIHRRQRGPTRRSLVDRSFEAGPPRTVLWLSVHHLCSHLVGLRRMWRWCSSTRTHGSSVGWRVSNVRVRELDLRSRRARASTLGDRRPDTADPDSSGWSITPTPAVNICPFATRTGSPKPASEPSVGSVGDSYDNALAEIRQTAYTRQNSSTNALPGRTSTTSSTPPSNTWT